MITYDVIHTTAYAYADPASLSYNEARLTPRSFQTPLFAQRVLETNLFVEPEWRDHSSRTDPYGNRVDYFTIRSPHSEMAVRARSRVELVPQPMSANFLASAEQSPPWESVAERMQTDLSLVDMRPFLLQSPLVPLIADAKAYSAESFTPNRPILLAAHELMHRIYTEFDYRPDMTTITTPLATVFSEKSGVCQDFAQFMLACLRSHGLASRYVSGYIETVPPPGEEKLEGSDASHAWVALFVPEVGWIDFDPTNDKITSDQHIILGWGRDFSDVTPLKGIFFGGGQNKLSVAVDVRRQEEEAHDPI